MEDEPTREEIVRAAKQIVAGLATKLANTLGLRAGQLPNDAPNFGAGGIVSKGFRGGEIPSIPLSGEYLIPTMTAARMTDPREVTERIRERCRESDARLQVQAIETMAAAHRDRWRGR